MLWFPKKAGNGMETFLFLAFGIVGSSWVGSNKWSTAFQTFSSVE